MAKTAKPELPKAGDHLTITVEVTRIGRNASDTADTITIWVPGHSVPVTVNADVLLKARAE